ncbi:MAG: hypothetical protein P8R54_24365 [Myxococcota bacterium]|nr:hypothetical protein [Myxococcota bacterium]
MDCLTVPGGHCRLVVHVTPSGGKTTMVRLTDEAMRPSPLR